MRRLGFAGLWSRVGVSALLVSLLVAATLGLAACSGGDADPTTSTSQTDNGSTTTASIPPDSSETTTVTVEATTTTGGIVISIPTTSSTELSTTTTEMLSSAEQRLPDGRITAMGFIDKVYVKDGRRYISIDYAEMLTGRAAIAAAVAAGVIEPGEDLPNDYWIRNLNPQKRIFEVSVSVAITTSTRWVEGDDMAVPCSWADFKGFWGPDAGLNDSEKHLDKVPWWIEREGPVVLKIDEQYLP